MFGECHNSLSSSGFFINKYKYMLSPSRSCRFLDVIFDTEHLSIVIPQEKRDKFSQKTLAMLSKQSCKIRLFMNYSTLSLWLQSALPYRILHTKILEIEKFLATLSSQRRTEILIPGYSLPATIKEAFYGRRTFSWIPPSATSLSLVVSLSKSSQTLR